MSMYFPRAVDDPRALPELRAALIDLATPDGAWHAAETQKLVMDLVGPPNERTTFYDSSGALNIVGPQGYAPEELQLRVQIAVEQADNTVRWYREKLPEAQLIHVSPEMTDFVVAAAEAVPADLTLSEEDAPAPTGLVVFGKPWYGTDAGPERPGEAVRVDAICWGLTRLPPRDVPWWDERSTDLRIPAVTIGMFRMIDPSQDGDELATTFATDRVIWVPLGRTDWPWGDPLNECPSMFLPNANPGQWESMTEDRRFLAALWATLNQKRLLDEREVLPASHVRKRLWRAGHRDRDETVKIIHLRRTEYQAVEPVEGRRHVGVRFLVKPFYRRQPYGPNRSLRRIALIPAHWRGPEGAPVKNAERIWELDK